MTLTEWGIWLFCALLVGMAKSGVKGLGMLLVPILAVTFGGKPSTGMLLPLLLMADVFAVRYYRRDADWSYVLKLIPAAAVGVLIAVWVGQSMNETTFRYIMAVIIIGGLLLLILQERRPPEARFIQHPVVAGLAGLAGGFTTMIGNAGGPVMSVYLLATRLPKKEFIGTGAWFFLLINLFKLPFHIWV
ncbi:MAG: sulfite exporter TauE/SafE family protein, partial [Lewinella sp.]|nr:sulfite exporter TauE/SafE family protein [Lewinella sp.]